MKGPWHRLSRVYIYRDIHVLIFTSSALKTWVLHVKTFYSWILLYISPVAAVNRYILSVLYITHLFLVTYSCDDDSWNIAYFTFNNTQSIQAFSDNKDGFKMYLMCFLMSIYRISYWYQMYSLSWRSNLLFSCGLLSYYYLLITIFFHLQINENFWETYFSTEMVSLLKTIDNPSLIYVFCLNSIIVASLK